MVINIFFPLNKILWNNYYVLKLDLLLDAESKDVKKKKSLWNLNRIIPKGKMN